MSSHHHLIHTEKKNLQALFKAVTGAVTAKGSELWLCHVVGTVGVAEGTAWPRSVHKDLCLAPFPSVPDSPNTLLGFVCMKQWEEKVVGGSLHIWAGAVGAAQRPCCSGDLPWVCPPQWMNQGRKVHGQQGSLHVTVRVFTPECCGVREWCQELVGI